VETFSTTRETAAAMGTVHGRQDVAGVPQTNDRLGTCLPGVCTCDGQPTCDYSGCIACPATAPRATIPAGEGQNVPVI